MTNIIYSSLFIGLGIQISIYISIAIFLNLSFTYLFIFSYFFICLFYRLQGSVSVVSDRDGIPLQPQSIHPGTMQKDL